MKTGILILCILFASGCEQPVTEADLKQLNGYWEIEKVTGPDGSVKTYGLNTSIDYLELNGMQGFRKKVHPQADGTFLTSDDATYFRLSKKGARFLMTYGQDEASWQELLLGLEADAFSVVNAENFTYHYKRYKQPGNAP